MVECEVAELLDCEVERLRPVPFDVGSQLDGSRTPGGSAALAHGAHRRSPYQIKTGNYPDKISARGAVARPRTTREASKYLTRAALL